MNIKDFIKSHEEINVAILEILHLVYTNYYLYSDHEVDYFTFKDENIVVEFSYIRKNYRSNSSVTFPYKYLEMTPEEIIEDKRMIQEVKDREAFEKEQAERQAEYDADMLKLKEIKNKYNLG